MFRGELSRKGGVQMSSLQLHHHLLSIEQGFVRVDGADTVV